jgi:hypothetical protein
VRILVLGGTAFVGRAIVADALRAGAEVTLFGRGKTGTGLFPGLTRLTGDRDTGDYAALREGSWDAVVYCSGYVPRHVGQAMDALGERAGLPATPLEVTAADVLAWDRDRGEPPLGHGFTPDQEQAVLARHDGAPGPEEGRETRPVRDNLDTA